MNSTRPLLYSLLIGLLAAGCTVRERHHDHVHRTWAAAAIKRIEIHEIAGAINVTAAKTDTIDLDASILAIGERKDKNYFETSIEGDTLVIGRKQTHGRHFFFNFNETVIDYELHVPPQIALELTTVNGRVSSRGVSGETEVTTVNGSIDLDTPGTSEVSAHTVNGRIACRFAENFQGASFKTVNGRVTAVLPASASFVGDFSQVNGDIEAAFPLNIHSHPGSRRVSGEVNGGQHELRIVTVNGDIKIENGADGKTPSVIPSTPGVPSQIPPPPPPPPPPTT